MNRSRFLSVLSLLATGCLTEGEQPGTGTGGAGAGGGGGSAGSTGGAGTGGVLAGMGGTAATAGQGGSAGSTVGGAGMTGAGAAGAPGGNAGMGGGAGSGVVGGASGMAGAGAGGVAGTAGAAGSAGSMGGAGAAGTAGTAGGTPAEEPITSLAATRQEHAVAALAGEIYVVGGYAPSATASVIAYDPDTTMWRSVEDFPGPLQHANVGVVNDKLYVAGFYIGGSMSNASPQVFEYDPVADAWDEKASLPTDTERAAACVATLGDQVFVFGGSRNGQTVAEASVYDATDDAWLPLPDMPEPREHCVAGTIGGKIYIVGGRANGIGGFEPTSLEFDPASPGYVQKAPIPTPRGGIAGAVLQNKLFVFGGEGNDNVMSGVFPNVDAYDPATNSWEALPPMDIPRHGLGAATLGERIYLPGGATTEGAGAVDDASVFFFE